MSEPYRECADCHGTGVGYYGDTCLSCEGMGIYGATWQTAALRYRDLHAEAVHEVTTLRARLEAVERERDELRAVVAGKRGYEEYLAVVVERDTARRELDALQRQSSQMLARAMQEMHELRAALAGAGEGLRGMWRVMAEHCRNRRGDACDITDWHSTPPCGFESCPLLRGGEGEG